MKQFNVYEAKTQLSRLLQSALEGEDIVIARDGVPVVRLVPILPRAPRPLLGLLRGQIQMSADFDLPLEDFADYQ